MRCAIRLFCRLFAALAVLLAVLAPASDSRADDYAFTLTITFDGVAITRTNASNAIALPLGAVSPVGAGDMLVLDAFGRALLDDGAGTTVLVLPSTTLEIVEMAQEGEQVSLALRVREGRIILAAADPARYSRFALIAADTVVRVAPALALVQVNVAAEDAYALDADAANPPPPTVHVVSMQGGIEVETGDEVVIVPQQHGLRVRADGRHTPLYLPAPATPARLDALLAGCAGEVNTRDGQDLAVRRGPSQSYAAWGELPDETPVTLMATIPSSLYTRVQFLSNFGWVETAALRAACPGLLVLSDQVREAQAGVYAPQPLELTLLNPFFGSPADDIWFYPLPVSE